MIRLKIEIHEENNMTITLNKRETFLNMHDKSRNVKIHEENNLTLTLNEREIFLFLVFCFVYFRKMKQVA